VTRKKCKKNVEYISYVKTPKRSPDYFGDRPNYELFSLYTFQLN